MCSSVFSCHLVGSGQLLCNRSRVAWKEFTRNCNTRHLLQEHEAIQDLQAGWASCLDSLCDRLRGVATAKEVEENEAQHRRGKFEEDCNHRCRANIETFTIAGSNERKHGHDFSRLSLNRMLLRVGARVPWGRQHRGRFAKVLLCRQNRSLVHPRSCSVPEAVGNSTMQCC